MKKASRFKVYFEDFMKKASKFIAKAGMDVSMYTVSEDSAPAMFSAPLEKVREAMLTVKAALHELEPLLAEYGVSKMYIYPEQAREDAINNPGVDVRVCFGLLGKEGELSMEQERQAKDVLAHYLIPKRIGPASVGYPNPNRQSTITRHLGLQELPISKRWRYPKTRGNYHLRRGAIRPEYRESYLSLESLPGDPDWQILKWKCKEEFVDKYKGWGIEVQIGEQTFVLGKVGRRGVAETEVPSGLDLNQVVITLSPRIDEKGT